MDEMAQQHIQRWLQNLLEEEVMHGITVRLRRLDERFESNLLTLFTRRTQRSTTS